MKKKIITSCLVVALLVVGIVGASLAYFTDKDAKDNVFTTGKVNISLEEKFEQGSKLLPATGSAQAGTLKNGVTKEIQVINKTGSEDAYVRVHIAIPNILDNGDPSFDAGKNVLHFNYDADSIVVSSRNSKACIECCISIVKSCCLSTFSYDFDLDIIVESLVDFFNVFVQKRDNRRRHQDRAAGDGDPGRRRDPFRAVAGKVRCDARPGRF